MRLLAATALVAAVAAGGCGGHARAREVKARLAPPRGCRVGIFFASKLRSGRDATGAEIAAVRDRLASSSKVGTYAFVSKRLALHRLSITAPGLVQGMPGNPLPPSYEIVPRSPDDADSIEAQFRGLPGVEHVSASRAC
jgi:cell division protein FtsX